MRTAIRFLLLAMASSAGLAGHADDPLPLFAYCVELGLPGVAPRPLSDQASMLRDLGYAGIGCELWLDDSLDQNLRILDEAHLPLSMVWTPVSLDPSQPPFDARLSQAIQKLKGRHIVVCVLLRGLPPGDPQGVEPAVKILRQLGEWAGEAGLKVSIYNHVGDWTESLPFVIDLVHKADHPQVGFNFNLCHWLKVSSEQDYRPLLREHVGKLFVVTINGATQGASEWTNGLIRPLDEGDFDNRALLATLREAGYPGPVGLMCYGVPGDPREHLARSMRAWRAFPW